MITDEKNDRKEQTDPLLGSITQQLPPSYGSSNSTSMSNSHPGNTFTASPGEVYNIVVTRVEAAREYINITLAKLIQDDFRSKQYSYRTALAYNDTQRKIMLTLGEETYYKWLKSFNELRAILPSRTITHPYKPLIYCGTYIKLVQVNALLLGSGWGWEQNRCKAIYSTLATLTTDIIKAIDNYRASFLSAESLASLKELEALGFPLNFIPEALETSSLPDFAALVKESMIETRNNKCCGFWCCALSDTEYQKIGQAVYTVLFPRSEILQNAVVQNSIP